LLLLALVVLVAVGVSVLGTSVSDVFDETRGELSPGTEISVPAVETGDADWRVRLP
jgi:hypothetical protein